MIIRIIFIVINILLTNSLLASSLNDTTWQLSLPDSYPILQPITSDELPDYSPPSSSAGNADSQTNSGEEYHTFEPGKEPSITVWTLFPGPKSHVDKPTVFTSQTTLSVDFASSGSEWMSKGSLGISF